jgi:hypothetical protein
MEMKKFTLKIVAAFLLAAISGPSLATSITRHVECICSIIQLVATPEKYKGQIITVRGVVGFNGIIPMIYLTAEHEHLGIDENAIRLGVEPLPEDTFKRLEKFKGKYVEVYGEFNGSAITVVSGVDLVSVKN